MSHLRHVLGGISIAEICYNSVILHQKLIRLYPPPPRSNLLLLFTGLMYKSQQVTLFIAWSEIAADQQWLLGQIGFTRW